MDLVIREADGQTMGDAYGLDGSFLVESELALFAEGGVIRYEVVPVPRYGKSYAGEDSSFGGGASGKAVFLAYLDGSIAGRVVLSEGWNRQAWIEDLAVDARRRRAGVGRALIDRAVAWAVERRLPAIRAETQNNNVPACKLYESCGFRLGGFDRDLYRGLDEETTEVALFWYRHLRADHLPTQTLLLLFQISGIACEVLASAVRQRAQLGRSRRGDAEIGLNRPETPAKKRFVIHELPLIRHSRTTGERTMTGAASMRGGR